ncbi:MAG TPA: hypothetical protein VK184_04640 [Nostocaceae cyanobacterium]|nr:hypothetical protein [Nostocaceae cyanobacterium]
MATIKLSELNAVGSELFQDSESFLNDMNDVDTMSVHGGGHDESNFSHLTGLGVKFLEFAYGAYAIDKVAYLAKSFSESNPYPYY